MRPRFSHSRHPGASHRQSLDSQMLTVCLATALLVFGGFSSANGQCTPENPDATPYLGVPWCVKDWGCTPSLDTKILANRRAHLYCEDSYWQGDQDDPLLLDLPSIFYYCLTAQFYRWETTAPHDFFLQTNLHENAFLHSSDPACLEAFSTAGGIELHWRLDLRLTPISASSWPLDTSPVPITRYRLWRNDGVQNVLIWQDDVGLSQTTYLDPAAGLEQGHSYTYRLESYVNRGTVTWGQYSQPTAVVFSPGTTAISLWLESCLHAEEHAYISSDTTISMDTVFGYHGTLSSGQSLVLQLARVNPGSVQPPYVLLEYPITYDDVSDRYRCTISTSRQTIKEYGGEAFRAALIQQGVQDPVTVWPKQRQSVDYSTPFFRSTLNNRIDHRGSSPSYLTDPGAAEWRDVYVNVALHYTAQGTCPSHGTLNGIFGDNAFHEVPSWICLVPPSDYGQTKYASDMIEFLKAIRQGLIDNNRADALVAINGLVPGQLISAVPTGEYAVNAGTMDGWSVVATAPQGGTSWLSRLKTMLTSVQDPANRSIILLSQATPADTRHRLMDLCSFLLSRNMPGQTEGLYMPNEVATSPKKTIASYPEMQLELGAPLHALDPDDLPVPSWSELLESEKSLLVGPLPDSERIRVRCFEHGIVLVDAGIDNNPSNGLPLNLNIASTVQQVLGQCSYPDTMYIVAIDGQTLEGGGTITSSPVDITQTFQTQPHTGYILMNSVVNSPSCAARCVYGA